MSRNVELSMSYHLCTTYNRLMEIARKIKDGAKQKKKKKIKIKQDINWKEISHSRNIPNGSNILRLMGERSIFSVRFSHLFALSPKRSATDLNVESCSFVTSGAKGKITSGAWSAMCTSPSPAPEASAGIKEKKRKKKKNEWCCIAW